MNLKEILCWAIVMAMLNSLSVRAKRLQLVPLSAREVYHVLRSVDRIGVVPQGRTIVHGIASVKGFALGLKKGFAGGILFGSTTGNRVGSATPTNKNITQPQLYEICFNSRNQVEILKNSMEKGIVQARQNLSPTSTGGTGSTNPSITSPWAVNTESIPGMSTASEADIIIDSGIGTDTSTSQDDENIVDCVEIKRYPQRAGIKIFFE